MLIEFRVANHRSIKEEQVLSMEAVPRIGDKDDPRPRKVAGHRKPLLPAAAIYGANASGKSNVLSAMLFMKGAIQDLAFSIGRHRDDFRRRRRAGVNVKHKEPNQEPEAIPLVTLRDPFRWDDARSFPTMLSCQWIHKGICYEYGFVMDDELIVEEWLHQRSNFSKQTLFTRDLDTFSFSKRFKGENRLIENTTRKDQLFLAAAMSHKHPQLNQLGFWFARWQHPTLRIPQADTFFPASDWRQYIRSHIPEEFKPQMLALLQAADLQISDFKQEKSRELSEYGVLLNHGGETGSNWLELENESAGTRTLFQMSETIIHTLVVGNLFIIDELESSLHPLLAMKIVDLFNNPETNPNNAQLIFATHDTNLLGTTLGESVLRRDQVWFTEKKPDGATELYPLTDYKPRQVENLERGYLQGRYGAVPFLGDFSALVPE